MVKSERAHDRISAGFSQLLQFPYILLLGNLLCQTSVLQLLCLDYMSVPLIRGNPAPPLTGLQPVVDPAILPSSGFGLLLLAGPDFAGDDGGDGGLADDLVRLIRSLERGQDSDPVRDATTMHQHTDRKALRRERQIKIALGHKEDDHEEEPTWQQTM